MHLRDDAQTVPGRHELEGLHYGRVAEPLDLEGLDRFTFPVRDLEKAELFYTSVIGGDVVQRGCTEIGMQARPSIRMRLAPGVDVCLVEQRFGWNPPDTANPHWGFAIPGGDVNTWMEHLTEWGVPNALVFRDTHSAHEAGDPTRVELHFLDPDGNQLELVAWDYPMNDTAWRGTYNYWNLIYRHDTWPPPDTGEDS